jgi:N6-adenosine-specific RNA methylase IME4
MNLLKNMNTKYKTIYADPPWNETGGGRIKRGADAHYTLMKTADIEKLDVASLADDNCHLYLWVTNNHLQDGLRVMKAWGFEYKTMITWVKDRIGLGQYFRGMTEHCLFGVKGNLAYKSIHGKRAQGKTFFYAKKQQHSSKPEAMRSMIERVSYAPRIELFARHSTFGWDVHGYEVNSSIIL